MREKQSDYFENSRSATYVQREYAELSPREYTGYDASCWGLSAGDGPTDKVPHPHDMEQRRFGYAARGAPYGPDDGTLSGSAALASLPFAPEIALPAIRTMIERYPEIVSQGRLTSGFNPSVRGDDGRVWVSPGHYGLDQGIVVLMIENYRSQMIWRLSRECPYGIECYARRLVVTVSWRTTRRPFITRMSSSSAAERGLAAPPKLHSPSSTRLRRSALRSTETELKLMASAASIGLRRSPKTG